MPYGKQMTQAEFEAQFEDKFGKGYDFSQSQYIGARSHIEILCSQHGAFQTTPYLLFAERTKIACPTCRKINREAERVEKARVEFLEKAKATYKEQYSYDYVVYVNSRSKVTISCKDHGQFQQTPGKFLAGVACPLCGLERRHSSRRLKKEDLLNRLQRLHGKTLQFQIQTYENTRQKIAVSCSLHGEFHATVANLLTGRGCPKCSRVSSSKKRTLSTKEWIKKAFSVHGSKYDYSKTIYRGSSQKLSIVCKEHGPFEIRASNHISKKQGCLKCVRPNASQSLTRRKPRVSAETFLTRFRSAHPTSNLEIDISTYVSMNTDVEETCKLHGNFKARAANLARGSGCPICASSSTGQKRKLPISTFVERCSQLYSNEYEYDYVDYTNLNDRILVECPQHGTWSIIAANHLSGKSGCPACQKVKQAERLQNNSRLSKEEFFNRCKQAHGGKYDYSRATFEGVMQSISIVCDKHGEFKQRAGAHMNGKGCPECGRDIAQSKLTSSKEHLLTKFTELHGSRYKYVLPPKSKYTDRITIACDEHGPFRQQIKSHLQGKGCPKCSLSKGENAVALFLERNGFEFEVEFAVPKPNGGNPMRFDFVIRSHKVLIEFDGHHHFQPVKFGGMSRKKAEATLNKVRARDKEKNLWAERNGYHLIRIRYDEKVSQRLESDLMQRKMKLP